MVYTKYIYNKNYLLNNKIIIYHKYLSSIIRIKLTIIIYNIDFNNLFNIDN